MEHIQIQVPFCLGRMTNCGSNLYKMWWILHLFGHLSEIFLEQVVVNCLKNDGVDQPLGESLRFLIC